MPASRQDLDMSPTIVPAAHGHPTDKVGDDADVSIVSHGHTATITVENRSGRHVFTVPTEPLVAPTD
jgi:hypothetical protein